MGLLRRFWVKFKLSMDDPHPAGALLGCGATAATTSEALELIQARVFGGETLPEVEALIQDVELSSLDPHVLASLDDLSLRRVFQRGVWYPPMY